jgi:hypothetical protein
MHHHLSRLLTLKAWSNSAGQLLSPAAFHPCVHVERAAAYSEFDMADLTAAPALRGVALLAAGPAPRLLQHPAVRSMALMAAGSR